MQELDRQVPLMDEIDDKVTILWLRYTSYHLNNEKEKNVLIDYSRSSWIISIFVKVLEINIIYVKKL